MVAGLKAMPPASSWSVASAGGNHPVWQIMAPPARAKAALAVDSRRRHMILLGGEDCARPRGPEVWQMPLDTLWAVSRLATRGLEPFLPAPPAAAYDSAADRLLVIAGEGCNEAWQLSFGAAPGATPTWSALPIAGPRPPPRIDPAIAFDSTHHRFIVVGGAAPGDNHPLDDVWILSIDSAPAWQPLRPSGSPPTPLPRYCARKVWRMCRSSKSRGLILMSMAIGCTQRESRSFSVTDTVMCSLPIR